MLKRNPEHYNYETFRTVHLIEDAERALEKSGIEIGSMAPDFELGCKNCAGSPFCFDSAR
ncbi:MAG: hypothetical protein ACR2I2_11015 [Bryobacteraceae bacterium]